MAPAQSQSSRSANACGQCRRRKVKCSGNQPCRNCTRQGVECTFPVPGRSRYSDAYVQGLLATIRRQDEQIEMHTRAVPNGRVTVGCESPVGQPCGQPVSPLGGTSSPAVSGTDGPHAVSPASTASTERAAGAAFELRVRSLLHSHAETDKHGSYAEDRVRWQSTAEIIVGAGRLVLPSAADSHRLLDLFLSYMGVNQHFIDPRTFVDTMTLLFQDERTRQAQMESVWFIEYLLVMAMGKLVDFDTQSSKPFPGAAYFAEAMQLLPPLHQLGGWGVIAVEILCLAATYLQWCDRKHDAYLHIGTAVRLAVALGCALPFEEQQCLPSEKAHRIRVWWTVFMLDRRLAAGIGLPVAADDRQLSADLPAPAPGFLPPEALIVNIKIARVTGNIMTTLYGSAAISQLGLVHNVQSILSSLYETGHSIPIEYTVNFTSRNMDITRTGASLYLMLFQAIILCIRPIVLQRVKDKVMASLKGTSLPGATPVIDRFCYTCAESATKSLRILNALRQNSQIARFGYFDLDATFSAALILVMIGFIGDVDSSKIPPELYQGAKILQYLSEAGNRAAEQRLSDIQQFCKHVWSNTQILSHATGDAPGESPPQPEVGQGQGNLCSLTGFDPNLGFGTDMNLEADGIYSSYNDPSLPLTGVDRLDWAEMEKVFTSKPV